MMTWTQTRTLETIRLNLENEIPRCEDSKPTENDTVTYKIRRST